MEMLRRRFARQGAYYVQQQRCPIDNFLGKRVRLRLLRLVIWVARTFDEIRGTFGGRVDKLFHEIAKGLDSSPRLNTQGGADLQKERVAGVGYRLWGGVSCHSKQVDGGV